MDRDSRQQDALLREVDDAYRQDQLTTFAKNHGLKLGIVVLAGLALFGGYLAWQSYREKGRDETSEEIVKAMDQIEAGNLATATTQLTAIEKKGSDGAVAVAKLSRAAVAMQQGRPADAARIYGEVAASGDTPQPYRDIALIRQVSVNYASMKPSEVVEKMKPLAKPGEPYFGSAGELLGAAYLDLGKPTLAGPLFAEIAKDENVPSSLRSRARQLAGLMGYDAIVDVDQTLKDMRKDEQQQQAAGAQ
ncbi:MAG: tetratricopeptide repeat protein [Novosphingobium sp.]|nr:tetratricopeptide repeat protein [Novosphingobium sp.]MBO9601375.1 tetratricopeptide repeat protein [Novosphingobium sp.]